MSIGHICVCICTYKRPKLLEKLLGHLQHQKTDGLFTYSIVVVDNDFEQSAKTTTMVFKWESLRPIDYYCETEKNIARARNKAVQKATGNYIAFIDDDEFPVNDWLFNLYKTCDEYRADGVLGPVLPYFEVNPPQWVIKGKFCERPTYETGTLMHWSNTRTGNVLLRRNIFEGHEYPFDPEFGAGGEDVRFFKEMQGKGSVFIWCNSAPVYEIVPTNRCTKRYFLRRAFLQGNISLQYYKNTMDNKQRIRIFIKSIIAFILYSFILPISYFLGVHTFMKYLIKDLHHISRFLALSGIVVVKNRDL